MCPPWIACCCAGEVLWLGAVVVGCVVSLARRKVSVPVPVSVSAISVSVSVSGNLYHLSVSASVSFHCASLFCPLSLLPLSLSLCIMQPLISAPMCVCLHCVDPSSALFPLARMSASGTRRQRSPEREDGTSAPPPPLKKGKRGRATIDSVRATHLSSSSPGGACCGDVRVNNENDCSSSCPRVVGAPPKRVPPQLLPPRVPPRFQPCRLRSWRRPLRSSKPRCRLPEKVCDSVPFCCCCRNCPIMCPQGPCLYPPWFDSRSVCVCVCVCVFVCLFCVCTHVCMYIHVFVYLDCSWLLLSLEGLDSTLLVALSGSRGQETLLPEAPGLLGGRAVERGANLPSCCHGLQLLPPL